MRYCGKIGYAPTVDTGGGIWTQTDVKEILYSGDIIRNNRRTQNSDGVNDDITISNEISILGDMYAFDHFYDILYAEFAGKKWKVTNVTINHPRLILTLGGVWNGPTIDSEDDRDSEARARKFAEEHM